MSRSAEGRGATVEEATLRALTELGATREEATVEVLAPGGRGLLGAWRRAHVRATVRENEQAPTSAPAPNLERRDDVEEEVGVAHAEIPNGSGPDRADSSEAPSPGSEPDSGEALATAEGGDDAAAATNGGEAAETGEATVEREADEDQEEDLAEEAAQDRELTPEERLDLLDEEAEIAADFLEGLLDRLDLPGDIEIEVHEEQAFVSVHDMNSGLLIGRRGATLDALQEIVRGAVQRRTERRSHVRVDVERYRARQIDKLREKCRDAIAQARESGKPVRLEPMDAYERKVMHDVVAKSSGVTSSSEGNEPKRRVVIGPSEDGG